jgi:hypothetical protein
VGRAGQRRCVCLDGYHGRKTLQVFAAGKRSGDKGLRL